MDAITEDDGSPDITEEDENPGVTDRRRFFRALGDGLPPDLWAHVWHRGGKYTDWVQIAADAEASASRNGRVDVYFSVALAKKRGGHKERLEIKDAVGMLAVVSDIDTIWSGRANTALPADENAALAFIDTLALTPTFVVDSGHGLQSWWVFVEPWRFGDGEREQAEQLGYAWQACVAKQAAEWGYAFDAVGDLARVMRLPGTINAKDKENTVPTRMVRASGVRYTREQIMDVCHDDGDHGEPTGADGEPVTDNQRFTSEHPCPICKGHKDLPQGQKERCWGYLSHDGNVAFCTREEFAKGRAPIQTRIGVVYAHFIPDPSGGPDTYAGRLLKLVRPVFHLPGNELFHDASGELWATIPVKSHHEAVKIKSRDMRLWLGSLYYQKYRQNCTPDAVAQQIGGLEAWARYHAEEHEVSLRIAQPEPNTIYIDLGTSDHSVVKIIPVRWSIVPDSPVRFRRAKSLLPLPKPVETSEGLEKLLRPYVNVDSDADWLLFAAYVCATFWPDGPFALLQLYGEAGSAKTTLARVVQWLVDPSSGDLLGAPKESKEMVVNTRNSYLLPFDNISHIEPWLSDMLCRIATGGGLRPRALYTDDEEIVFAFKRPVVLTGVDEVITRTDLLDRSLSVALKPPKVRREEAEFKVAFAKDKPAILGALYSTVSQALARLPGMRKVALTLPRMADFYLIGLAVTGALGYESARFVEAYEATMREGRDVALEANVIFATLISWLDTRRGRNRDPDSSPTWEGNMAALLDDLNFEREQRASTYRSAPPPRGWPTTPRGLQSTFNSIAKYLREIGIDSEFLQHGRRYRIIDNRKERGEPRPRPDPLYT
jgi:hypothetical protein